MTSSLAMRSWEARQEKVTRLFMYGLLRGELGIPGAFDTCDFHTG
jgi:hypothetical protein